MKLIFRIYHILRENYYRSRVARAKIDLQTYITTEQAHIAAMKQRQDYHAGHASYLAGRARVTVPLRDEEKRLHAKSRKRFVFPSPPLPPMEKRCP